MGTQLMYLHKESDGKDNHQDSRIRVCYLFNNNDDDQTGYLAKWKVYAESRKRRYHLSRDVSKYWHGQFAIQMGSKLLNGMTIITRNWHCCVVVVVGWPPVCVCVCGCAHNWSRCDHQTWITLLFESVIRPPLDYETRINEQRLENMNDWTRFVPKNPISLSYWL